MNASSVNWRNKKHDNITLKKISYNFFNEILDWEIFQAILGKFRGNSDWNWGPHSVSVDFTRENLPS